MMIDAPSGIFGANTTTAASGCVELRLWLTDMDADADAVTRNNVLAEPDLDLDHLMVSVTEVETDALADPAVGDAFHETVGAVTEPDLDLDHRMVSVTEVETMVDPVVGDAFNETVGAALGDTDMVPVLLVDQLMDLVSLIEIDTLALALVEPDLVTEIVGVAMLDTVA